MRDAHSHPPFPYVPHSALLCVWRWTGGGYRDSSVHIDSTYVDILNNKIVLCNVCLTLSLAKAWGWESLGPVNMGKMTWKKVHK